MLHTAMCEGKRGGDEKRNDQENQNRKQTGPVSTAGASERTRETRSGSVDVGEAWMKVRVQERPNER